MAAAPHPEIPGARRVANPDASPADRRAAELEELKGRIEHEAVLYATIFDAVRLRMEGLTKPQTVQTYVDVPVLNHPGKTERIAHGTATVPALLSGSDLKDIATTLYIRLRGRY